MPAKNIKKYAITFCTVALLGACGTSSFLNYTSEINHSLPAANVDLSNILDVSQPTVSGHYLASKVASSYGENNTALENINEAIDLGAGSKNLYRDAYGLALISGEIELAETLSQEISYVPDNIIVSPEILQSVISFKDGDFIRAEYLLNKSSEGGLGNIVVTLLKSWVLYAQGKPIAKEELKELESKLVGLGLLGKYQVALLFEASGDKIEAANYYGDVSRADYLPAHMVLGLAAHYSRTENLRGYERLVDKFAKKMDIEIPSFEKLSLKNNSTTNILASDGASEVFLGMSSMLSSIGAFDSALVRINLANYLQDNFGSAMFMEAQIHEETDETDKAVALYKQLETDQIYGNSSSLQLAYLYQLDDDYTASLEQVDMLIRGDKLDKLDVWLAKGDILRNLEKYTESIEAYSSAIASIDKKSSEHWTAFYLRGISYERSGDWQKAEADFLEALRLQPDQPEVLNYLGYSWVTQNRQLNQAKAMISKAVIARPQNAQIVDSMGWALYRLGEYDKSIVYMERALYLSPGDATINEHLGDVYWRMGYKTQARFQWEKALQLNPTEKGQAEGLKGKIASGLPAADVPKTDIMQADKTYDSDDQQHADANEDSKNTAQ